MKSVLNRLFIFIAALLLLISARPSVNAQALFQDYAYSVTFYVKDFYEDLTQNDTGIFYTVFCEKEKEYEVSKRFSNILGKSYTFKNSEFNFEEFIKKYNFKIKIEQQIDGLQIFYLYGNLLKEKEIINGQTVNLQIAVSNDHITAGIPLILGAY